MVQGVTRCPGWLTVLGSIGLVLFLAAPADPATAAKKNEPVAGDWPAITAEERAMMRVDQDPDADAVILMRERTGKVVPKGADTVNVIEFYQRMKILHDRGKEYGEVQIRAGKYSRVGNIRARTVKADGTVVPVLPDQIFEKVLFQIGSNKETAWVFNFPAVEKGAILEYRYDRHDNAVIFIDPWFFAGPEFTLRSRVLQAFPGDMGYVSMCSLCPADQKPQITPWREGKSKGNLYTQEIRNLPGYKDELMMPPERDANARMEMVLAQWYGRASWALGRQDKMFVDWPSVSLYASAYYNDAIKSGLSDLKPVVAGWTQGVTDPQEKIRVVFRHVQSDFRYLSYASVIGASHSISTILKEKIADNEDKGVLLAAALKVIGVDPVIALVAGREGGTLNPNFFSLSQFTHAVVGIPQGTGMMWLDPTVAWAPFGFVPWKDSGAAALLLKGLQGELITLPAKTELSASRYRATVRPRMDGRAEVEIEAEFLGEDAIEMREELAPASETARDEFLKEWLGDRRPGSLVKSRTFHDLDAVDQPLRITLVFETGGLVTRADDLLLVRACVLTCEDSNPISRGQRQHAFYVDPGWNREETVVVRSPEGMQPGEMPAAVAAKSEVATLTFSCFSQEDGARCSRQFVARRSRWPASVQDNVRKMFDKVVEADRTAVPFRPADSAVGGRN